MAWNSIHLLDTALACLLLIASSAITMSRARHPFHETQEMIVSENSIKMISEETEEDDFIRGRMDIQINDYPPTGANPNHTPKPPR
ncbi:hypothetical protein Nepgr_027998 [Nepenthes gracilis]|uniref:Uncharacterized protein n=1 Tax=Nepenthes gracilis TaxID=150966 RepID=A0AAD3TAX0_NEPGR|nr:hypothetical protein Nepgr_027998 [Nepenthes gracilis]